MEHLKTFNKKSLDEVWTSLVMQILKLHSTDSHFEQAIEMSDPGNNMST
jgi:hypothetical protein